MFTYSEHVLKICVAQLSSHAGYKSINGLAFEILIDLLSRFMLEFGKLSVSFANQCNRTQVNFDDIQFVFKSLGLNLADLTGYLVSVRLPFAGQLPPIYPICLQNKPPVRINFPTKSECELRKQFYEDWQPTLNLDSKQQSSFFSRLSPQEQQTIEERLEQLDLVDYFEQQRKLKIVDDTKLNQKVLNHIRSKVNELNISGFTDLAAQVPNYIYLSTDGKVLSFGNRPGRLPEARKHSETKDSERSSTRHRHLKSKKKSSKKSKSSSAGVDKKSKRSKRHEQFDQSAFDLQSGQIAGDHYQTHPLDRSEATLTRVRERLQQSVEESDRHKSCEQIVAELMDEMISSVEDKFNGLDESFYDENEAAKTLVLLSYDSNNSKSFNSSAAESPVIERNNIDYSLSKFNSFHYQDLNNYSPIADLNNNSITPAEFKDQLRNGLNGNGSFSNRLNSSSLSAAAADSYPVNDVKKLTIRDDPGQDDEDQPKLTMNSSHSGNSNLPKLKLPISFDKYKRGDSSLEDDAEIDRPLSKQPPPINTGDLPGNSTNKSTGKTASRPATDHKSSSITTNRSTNKVSNKSDLHHLSSTSPLTTNTKDKPQRKRKGKKQLSNGHLDASIAESDPNESIPKEKIYYCPTCNKPDDSKTPMIGCDSCEGWYHWPCQNIFVEPKEEEWFCLNCQVQQSLAEQAAKKLNKKKRIEEREKKRSKHSTKDGKHSAEESKHSGKEKPGKPVKSEKQNGHHDAQGKKRNKDAQKNEDKKLQKQKGKKKAGQPSEDASEEEEYYCPTCSKKDDGSPMVCCDDCDLWFHFTCTDLKIMPSDKEQWYCVSCAKKIKKKKLKK